MNNKNALYNILDSFENGVITAEKVREYGIHGSALKELVDSGVISRYSRGIYVRNDVFDDEFYLYQLKYPKGIISHDTALYLHEYSDRAPHEYYITFPKGYNAPSLKNENIIVKRVVEKNYYLGITELISPYGNTIKVYDLERTICDIFRGEGSEIQIINDAVKKYVTSSVKDINKLMKYAKQLKVSTKVGRYLEVLL